MAKGQLDSRNMSGTPGKAPMIGVRLPTVHTDRVDRIAKADGVSRSEVVRRALMQYLDDREAISA